MSWLAARSLSTAHALRSLKSDELEELVRAADQEQRTWLALFVEKSDHSAAVAEERQSLSVRQYEAAIRQGLVEIRAARTQDQQGLAAALRTVLARAVKCGPVSDTVLVDVAGAVPTRSDAGVAIVNEALKLLAQRLRSSEDAVALSREWDLETLSRAARDIPFERLGGRSQLVAALHATDRVVASDPRWWTGVTPTQLLEAGHGPLAGVLEDDVIAQRVVKPLMDEWVDSLASRAALAELWAAPRPVAQQVDPKRFNRALARLAERDPVASTWRDELMDQRGRDELVAAVEESERARLAAQEAQRAAEAERDRLSAENRRLDDLVRSAKETASRDRSAHDRQIRLDLLRAMALVLAQVDKSGPARDDEALQRSLEYQARKLALASTGRFGEVVRFDPAFHDPVGTEIKPETEVTVVRAGYTWSDGSEDLVLVKAQVAEHGGRQRHGDG
jgi:hypothetical protein